MHINNRLKIDKNLIEFETLKKEMKNLWLSYIFNYLKIKNLYICFRFIFKIFQNGDGFSEESKIINYIFITVI